MCVCYFFITAEIAKIPSKKAFMCRLIACYWYLFRHV